VRRKIYELLFAVFLIIGLVLISNYAQQNKSDLTRFLKSTHFIDSNNPKIIAKAKELTIGCKTDAEKTKALFEFVRDSHNSNRCESFIASEVLECGGNSCRQRSIFLAALCRAVGIPSRLHLQKVTLKNWKNEDGTIGDITFAHGLTGIYINGNWHLYESVGNKKKWVIWTQDEQRASEMPAKFYPNRDCLFKPDKKIIIETLPIYFADRTKEMINLIKKIDNGKY